MIAALVFWLSILLVAHTYVLYPLILVYLSRNRKGNEIVYGREDVNLPFVSVIISAYNEESCIAEKIRSIFEGSYPADKFEVLVGSDASSDSTVQVASQLTVGSRQLTVDSSQQSSVVSRQSSEDILSTVNRQLSTNLKVFDFKERRGKQNVVNDLVRESRGEILVLTDANVMFDRDTLYYMVRHFRNPMIGLVDTNMINRGMKESGISYQEKAYISREVHIKDMEGRIWGAMMGPFGGCYAIRKEDYSKVPSNYLVDDFYINMKIFEKGKLAINDVRALVFEELPEELKVEFRRKIRIGTGDFQNLRAFWRLIFSRQYGFPFLSHKVIRWFGPFFLLAAFFTNLLLAFYNPLYPFLMAAQVVFYFVPLFDWLFKRAGVHLSLLRLVTHFISMNIALFIGFFKSLGTVRSGVWERTSRG
jgi:cellulose synthase/poly-beta-1,6-N-acetylglucosamine synthase-like glycosyltransferase